MSLFDMLRDPLVDNMNVDGDERLELHHRILAGKKMLKRVFSEFHQLFLGLYKKYLAGSGIELEIGAGVAPIRDSYPHVLATDIVGSPWPDRVTYAQSMESESNSVRAIYGQNCFHHLPDPDKFFNELERVLVPGGGVVLLEPYYGPVASFLFKRLFHTEGYDKQFPDWKTPVAGPMNGANQALSYIVFVRDRVLFEKKHPQLRIVHQQVVPNYLKYIFSGGLNFRQLLPGFCIPLLFTGMVAAAVREYFCLHHVVVIQKVDS